jgi:hypothetical protein
MWSSETLQCFRQEHTTQRWSSVLLSRMSEGVPTGTLRSERRSLQDVRGFP